MSKKHKSNRILKIVITILLIIVSVFAVINLLTHDYIRDVVIKHQNVE